MDTEPVFEPRKDKPHHASNTMKSDPIIDQQEENPTGLCPGWFPEEQEVLAQRLLFDNQLSPCARIVGQMLLCYQWTTDDLQQWDELIEQDDAIRTNFSHHILDLLAAGYLDVVNPDFRKYDQA